MEHTKSKTVKTVGPGRPRAQDQELTCEGCGRDLPVLTAEELAELDPASRRATERAQQLIELRAVDQPVTIELRLTRVRWEKLVALAEARGRTETRCLLDLIDACVPGGGGWEAPAVKARRREREERRGE